jgi:hypothetical protein
MKRFDLLVVVCVMAVLPFLMGAVGGSVTGVTPNPVVNGLKLGSTLDMEGTYFANGRHVFTKVYGYIEPVPNPNNQVNSVEAYLVQNGIWKSRHIGVNGQFSCYGATGYMLAGGGMQEFTFNYNRWPQNVTVQP